MRNGFVTPPLSQPSGCLWAKISWNVYRENNIATNIPILNREWNKFPRAQPFHCFMMIVSHAPPTTQLPTIIHLKLNPSRLIKRVLWCFIACWSSTMIHKVRSIPFPRLSGFPRRADDVRSWHKWTIDAVVGWSGWYSFYFYWYISSGSRVL
jgi:hypothetical protein